MAFLTQQEPSKPMGAVWFAMGLATMLFPKVVRDFAFQQDRVPTDNVATLDLVTRCFGAQATMCGILLSTTRMDKRAYDIWGKAVLPFFAFDYLAWKNGYITDLGAIGDAVGNLIFVFFSGKGAGWF
jgi:hypothetical protein